MTSEEIKAIGASIKLNAKRLDECVGPHVFASFIGTNFMGFTNDRHVRCDTCKGEIDRDALRWYLRGLTHGRAGASDAETLEKLAVEIQLNDPRVISEKE